MFFESEIIIPQGCGDKIFCHKGLQSGPSLAVIGCAVDMTRIAGRMEKIPSLAYMRGSITIYAVGDDAIASELPAADDVLVLLDRAEQYPAKPAAALYWQVLSRAASLGIIAGRGVPVGPTRITWH